MPAGRLVGVDIALNFLPGAVFGLLAGFGPAGAVLLGGVTWGSSWVMAAGALDRGGRFGNRETPAALAVLVLEHTATAFYLPLAAALLAPGDAASRITALLGSAAAVAFAGWLVLGPAPQLRAGLFGGPASGAGPALLLAGAALALAGLAAAIGVATAGIAYLAGVVLAAPDPAGGTDQDGTAVPPAGARRSIAGLRDGSAALAGLALGLLVPAAKLPGALAGGVVLAALTGATKVLTGWWAAGRLRAGARSSELRSSELRSSELRSRPRSRAGRPGPGGAHPDSPGRTGRGGRHPGRPQRPRPGAGGGARRADGRPDRPHGRRAVAGARPRPPGVVSAGRCASPSG